MKALDRIIIAVVALVVGVPLVAVAGIMLWFHHLTTGPDVRKEATSAKAREQRAAAVAILDQTMGTFASTAPHGIRLATSVLDRCDSESGFLGERPLVSCTREISVYLAFDGNSADLRRAWDKSLAAAHWKPSEHEYRYEFADSPAVRLQWSTRPTAREPIGGFEKGIPVTDYDRQITLEQQPVDLAALYQDAYAHHRYVVELSAGSQYYPEAPKAPQSPAPAPSPTSHGCFNGHNCPGG